MTSSRRYRVHQPESIMHGWVVNATEVTDTLAGCEITYLAFRHDGIDYGVPLDWCVQTERPLPTSKEKGEQIEMGL